MDSLIDAPEGALAQKFDRLEDGVIYRVCFRDFNGPGKHEFMDILYLARHWWKPERRRYGADPGRPRRL